MMLSRRLFMLLLLSIPGCATKRMETKEYKRHNSTAYEIRLTTSADKISAYGEIVRIDKYDDVTKIIEKEVPKDLKTSRPDNPIGQLLYFPFEVTFGLVNALVDVNELNKKLVKEKQLSESENVSGTSTVSIPEKFQKVNVSIPRVKYFAILETDKNGKFSFTLNNVPFQEDISGFVEATFANNNIEVTKKVNLVLPPRKIKSVQAQTSTIAGKSNLPPTIKHAAVNMPSNFDKSRHVKEIVNIFDNADKAVKLYRKYGKTWRFVKALLSLIGKTNLLGFIATEVLFEFMDRIIDNR